jgi:hypothetical protein
MASQFAPLSNSLAASAVGRWMNEGVSLFARQWQAIQDSPDSSASKAAVLPNTS